MLISLKLRLIKRKYPKRVKHFWNEIEIDNDHVEIDQEVSEFVSGFSWRILLGLK